MCSESINCTPPLLQQIWKVVCDKKGKNLHLALPKCTAVIQQWRHRGQTLGHVGNNDDSDDERAEQLAAFPEFRREITWVFKVCASLASRKSSYLGCLPYLFARLEFPGVAAQTLELFEAKPEEEWDQWTLRFLSRRTESLRGAVSAITPEGGNLSNALKLQVEKLKSIPMYSRLERLPYSYCQVYCQQNHIANVILHICEYY